MPGNDDNLRNLAWSLWHKEGGKKVVKDNCPDLAQEFDSYYSNLKPTKKEYWSAFFICYLSLLVTAPLSAVIIDFLIHGDQMSEAFPENLKFSILVCGSFGLLASHSVASSYRKRK